MGISTNERRTEEDNQLKKNAANKVLHKISNSRTQMFVLFLVIFLFVNHFDFFKHPTDSMISNIRMAILGTNLVVVYLGVIFLPATSKGRPFNGLFWKLVQSLTLAYALNVLFLCFFSKENLQLVLRDIFDSSLGVPLPDKNYAADCRLITPEHPTSWMGNLTDHIDIFVLAHFLGWTFKVWIFRNTTVAWLMSLGFEVMELTLEVYLPNFRECWWDHLLLDIFGCNLIGMLIGFYTIRKFKMRKLHWFMEPSEKTAKMTWYQKFIYSFTSRKEYIMQDKWHWLTGFHTFNGVLFFFCTNFALDLSYFFVKSQIHMPPPHWIFAIRIWVLAFFSILAANDYYDYIVERSFNAMTMPLFLMFFVIGIEWIMFYKNMSEGLFDASLHWFIKVFWTLFLTFWAGVNLYFVYEKYFQNSSMVRFMIRRKMSESSSTVDSVPTQKASARAAKLK